MTIWEANAMLWNAMGHQKRNEEAWTILWRAWHQTWCEAHKWLM